MSQMALFLLGRPRIECGGTPIQVDRRKAIALLAYLAVTAETHSRDVLSTLLWPEYGQASALGALRTTLSVLKKAIGSDWLSTDWETVSLNYGANIWVDVAHFCGLLAECQTHGHPAEQVCPACLAPLTEAVDLYRGDFLDGFTLRDVTGFDDWQRCQSEALSRELIRALEKLVRCHIAQEEFLRAIVYTRRWLTLEPLHEPAHRQMMRLYAWVGQRAAAFRQYQECAQVLEEELGMPLQGATIQLYQDVKENRVPAPPVVPSFWAPSQHLSNLPSQPTPFVGRERELDNIAKLLGNPACRLLTLVGPGGIGKTRLALQAAVDNGQDFLHGVCFVPLAPLSSAELLAPTIADALKFPLHGGAVPKAQLLGYLHDKDILLVLDNVEHLLEGTELLAQMLQNAPGVKLLVTSRERLNLQWEWLLEIEGLCFPRDGRAASIEDYSAVQLFLQSASRIQPNQSLSEQEKSSVIRICQFLGGMPLGIELAAALTQVLGIQEIAQEIEQNLGLFATSLRDVPERHRSLRAVFDHSWNLLSEKEKHVFSKLSVFRGGFRREAAEKVAGASLPLLSAVARKSFVRRTPAGRYEILEVLRHYGQEKLDQDPRERNETHDLHCEYYAEFLHQQEDHLKGERQKEALEKIGQEIENVRVAWRWAVEYDKVAAIEKSLASLCLFYEIQSWFQEGEEVLEKAAGRLAAAGEPTEERSALLGKILVRQGRFCQNLSRFEKSKRLLQGSLAIFRCLGARREMAFSLNSLGHVAWKLEEYAKAKELLHESLTISQEIGDRWSMAHSLSRLAIVHALQKDHTAAKQLLQESLAISQEIGDRWGIAIRLTNLGVIAEESGQYEEAKRLYQESLAIFKEVGDRHGSANALNNLGFALCMLGEDQEATECFHKALDIATDTQLASVALEALVGVATLLARAGEKERALELVVYVLHHPAVYVDIKDRAKQLVSELKSQFSPQAFAMTQARGQARQFRFSPYGMGQAI